MLNDVEHVIMGKEVPRHEVLRKFNKRLDRYSGGGFTTMANWTENYDVFLHRCDEMNALQFNVMKVPNHRSLSVRKLDARLFHDIVHLAIRQWSGSMEETMEYSSHEDLCTQDS